MPPISLFEFENSEGEGGDAAVSAWTRPDDWPSQFKSPDDVLKSYQESQAEMNRLRQQGDADRAQFAETLAAMETLRPEQEEKPGAFDPEVAAWTDAIERGDYSTAMRIQRDSNRTQMIDAVGKVLDERFKELQPVLTAQTAAQRESQLRMAEDLAARELGPDVYAALLPKIQVLVAEHPNYLPDSASVEGYRDAIVHIARLADYERQATELSEMRAERAEKLAAQTVTGAGRVANVATGDEAQAEFARIKATPTGSYTELMSR